MKVIAHRGGAGLRVENTLAAFEHAIRLGAAGAELDVRLSADGEVVVHHNATLNPAYTRDAAGHWLEEGKTPELAALSHRELRAHDIGVPRPGSAYAERFDQVRPVPGQRIPLLREVIALARDLSDDFGLVVEIKTSMLSGGHRDWEPLVDAVLGILERERFAGRARLCSFDWGAMVYARRQWDAIRTWMTTLPASWYADGEPPEADIPPDADFLAELRRRYHEGGAPWFGGHDPRDVPGGPAEAIAAAGGEAWFMYHRDCTATSVRAARAHGLAAAAWSVNLRDEAAIQRLADLGVQFACLDYPRSGQA